jgi:hypothetical protein
MSEKLWKKHKELMHYTSASGLQGIVTSKKLWASHTSFLNDTEEVEGFFTRVLPVFIKPELERYIRARPSFADDIQVAKDLGIDLFDHWHQKIVTGLREAERRAQDHYVVSFCTTEDEWISRNGLLSQWRGYESDGGYAIVLDAKKLHSMLLVESENYYEERLLLTEIQYDMAELSKVTDEQVLEYVQRVKEGAYTYLITGKLDRRVYEALESSGVLSVLCKHRGFEEEKEVRIVVSEPSFEVGPDSSKMSDKPYRKMHNYLRDGVSVPSIHLFEDQKLSALPIRRIIVGPHPEKKQREKAVEILLRSHNIEAEVLISDTPFRGK